jgi:hypothetical protein
MTTTQVQSIESTLENIRFPFQPQFDPRKKLADEIEVCICRSAVLS